jgi:hypothetical protein
VALALFYLSVDSETCSSQARYRMSTTSRILEISSVPSFQPTYLQDTAEDVA